MESGVESGVWRAEDEEAWRASTVKQGGEATRSILLRQLRVVPIDKDLSLQSCRSRVHRNLRNARPTTVLMSTMPISGGTGSAAITCGAPCAPRTEASIQPEIPCR